ncbi:MAG: RNA polymerase sigma factor [Solirubrobacterales bacterium]|nr:RNA polymerase sigma factor [Solirubrobacterales bacterium]
MGPIRKPAGTAAETTSATVEAVWRIESARLIATLSRLTGDVGLAEDMAQDALVAALEGWPRTGVPDNPSAWLITTARNRGIDRIRRDKVLREKYEKVASEMELSGPEPGPEQVAFDEDRIGDDVLTLIFTACHPELSAESQVALTLKTLAGLSTEEIARAFLVSKATISQRIVRAKRTLAESEIRFEPPAPEEMGERLGTVLGVVYLIFNEGYSATAGEDWMRTELSAEALRLGRILAGLAPAEPEVHGLVALMEIQASRFPARIGPDGDPVLLMDQDRARWDRLLIRRGLERLELAGELGGSGPYFLQASIAACHARASAPEQTDWDQIVGFYDALLALRDTPVARLNRAVAVSMAGDPGRALAIVDDLAGDRRMEGYHLLPSVRGDLLEKLGRGEEAAAEFARAASLTGNEQERKVLEGRALRASKGFSS